MEGLETRPVWSEKGVEVVVVRLMLGDPKSVLHDSLFD